jgi:hypothetical protein
LACDSGAFSGIVSSVTLITDAFRKPPYISIIGFRLEAPMSATFVNWTSRVAIEGRVAELRRQSHSSNETMIPWDYHLPFGKIEARTEASKWIWHI